jgi:CRISPR system Cascade subunit CasB
MTDQPNMAARALGWWHAMQPDAPDGGDRAAAARLRRCAIVADAMQEPATMLLFRCLGLQRHEDLPRAALLAAVLAHVRAHAPGAPFARAVGPQQGDDATTAAISPLRFRRLLQARTPDEQLAAFRRAIALARDAANVADLAQSLLDWNEKTRRRWIFQYWNADERAPAATEPAPAA